MPSLLFFLFTRLVLVFGSVWMCVAQQPGAIRLRYVLLANRKTIANKNNNQDNQVENERATDFGRIGQIILWRARPLKCDSHTRMPYTYTQPIVAVQRITYEKLRAITCTTAAAVTHRCCVYHFVRRKWCRTSSSSSSLIIFLFYHRQHVQQSFIREQILVEFKKDEIFAWELRGKWKMIVASLTRTWHSGSRSTDWDDVMYMCWLLSADDRMKWYSEKVRVRWWETFRDHEIDANWQHVFCRDTAIEYRLPAPSLRTEWRRIMWVWEEQTNSFDSTFTCKFYIQFTLCWMRGEPQCLSNSNPILSPPAARPWIKHKATLRFISKSHNFSGDGWHCTIVFCVHVKQQHEF